MYKDAILSVLRNLGSFGAGILVAKGVFDEATGQAVLGAVITLVSALWGVLDKKDRA